MFTKLANTFQSLKPNYKERYTKELQSEMSGKVPDTSKNIPKQAGLPSFPPEKEQKAPRFKLLSNLLKPQKPVKY